MTQDFNQMIRNRVKKFWKIEGPDQKVEGPDQKLRASAFRLAVISNTGINTLVSNMNGCQNTVLTLSPIILTRKISNDLNN